jgi:hypothetical protein
MGCDIHIWTEIQAKDGSWDLLESKEAYDGRNYGLFSILANVRNGYGAAGCDTGDGFVPISMPKGIPEDASDFYKSEVSKWGIDGHSHSFLTLKEFLDYDWDQVTVKRGVVGPKEYEAFKENGKPESYSGGAMGSCVINVSNEEMEGYIENKDNFEWLFPFVLKHLEDNTKSYPREWPAGETLRASIVEATIEREVPNHSVYTSVSWETSYREACTWWFKDSFPNLEKNAPDGDPERIRVVFFFDN